jgi:hypothetical protein
MNSWSALSLAAAIGGACLARAQQQNNAPTGPLRYSAAVLSTNLAVNDPRLTVFPFDGDAFSIALPIAVDYLAFTLDGKTMYGSARRNLHLRMPPDPDSPTLYKIEFGPTRASPIQGSAVLRPIYSVAVSQRGDKIVVVAGFAAKRGCGIFELSPFDGALREVAFDVGCQPADSLSHWAHLNVSPDGKFASASKKHTMEIIDLVSGTIRLVGERFMEAAWSPDGKWIAGLEAKWTGRTILMDPNTLEEKRTVPQSQCQWSPDSRYLLQNTGGILRAIDVGTGRERTIVSSKDKVVEVSTAWVSNEIRP